MRKKGDHKKISKKKASTKTKLTKGEGRCFIKSHFQITFDKDILFLHFIKNFQAPNLF